MNRARQLTPAAAPVAPPLDVHPDVGTLTDFKTFLRAAHDRGLRVITELRFPGITPAPYFFTLGPHGFLWFELLSEPRAAAPQDGASA